MCLALFLWYIRMLHLFVAFERLGTKLLMIFNTVNIPFCEERKLIKTAF